MRRTDFIKAIIADPESDTLRLIFADWLEEDGDSDYASFIRVQCELAKWDTPIPMQDVITLDDGRRYEFKPTASLRRREWELWDSDKIHCHLSVGNVPLGLSLRAIPLEDCIPPMLGIVRRGLVAEVHCTLREWMGEPCPGCARIPARFKPLCKLCNGSGTIPGHGPAIVAAHPVERVVLSDLRPRESGVHWCWYMDDMPRQLFELVRLAVRDAASGAYSSLARLACISEQAARDALSAAAIAWAKQQQTPQFQSLCLQSPPPCPVCSVSMPREYGDGCCRSCHESGMVRGRRGWRQLGVYDG